MGTPASTTRLQLGDWMLCYGLGEDLARLRARSTGDAGDGDHELAKKRQRLRLVEERVEDQIAEAEPRLAEDAPERSSDENARRGRSDSREA